MPPVGDVHAVDQAVLHDLLLDGGDIHVLAAARADDVEREVRALVTLLPAIVDLHATSTRPLRTL